MLATPIPNPVWEKRDGWAAGGETAQDRAANEHL